MTETPTGQEVPIEIYRHLSRKTAVLIRAAIAAMGFPAHCPFKACRRSGTCATRHLLCWQVNHEAMNRIFSLAAARRWKQGPTPGEEPGDWEPEQVRRFERLLAEEEAGERGALRDRIAGKAGETES